MFRSGSGMRDIGSNDRVHQPGELGRYLTKTAESLGNAAKLGFGLFLETMRR